MTAPRSAPEVDWQALRAAATAAAAHAYAPYSGLRVGAAGLTGSGRIVVGCNVENASYGLGLCAECGLVSALHAQGAADPAGAADAGAPGRLIAVSCVDGSGELLAPCGRCRQLLLEHGGTGVLIERPSGPRPLGELLPESFGPADLP